MYIVGGYDSRSTEYLHTLIRIDLSHASQDTLSYEVVMQEHGPYNRANSSCCLVKDQIYLFGGGNMEDVFDDLWVLETEGCRWERTARGS